MTEIKKYNHYFKKVPCEFIDVYRVLDLFNVTDPAIQHAIKKLLVAGGRGHKDINKDIQESIDALERWKQMREEEIGCKITPSTTVLTDQVNTIKQSLIYNAENK